MIRPTRTSVGIAALALALTVVALLLLMPAAALAAGSLALFLLWRGWRFECDLMSAVASLAVDREVDRTILRQGATVNVRVQVTLAVPTGMEVRVRDLPPAIAAGEGALCDPGRTAAYTFRPMAPGETAFCGVVLEASDAFFSRDLVCRRFGAPHLRVFPAGATETGRGKGSSGGDAEVDRQAELSGQSVRGFRPYQTGDDPGLIDWKLSARRNAPYIRQLTALEGGTPLIVVDLPARIEDDPEGFARFSMAACSAVEGAIDSHDGCSLMVVAGGEIVRYLPLTQDLREALAVLGGLAPVEPRTPLYRAPGPAVLAARVHRSGAKGSPGERTYGERLGGVLSAFAAESPAPFTAAVRSALGRAGTTEAWIYSLLPAGDMSHLIQITYEAKVRGMRVVLKAPSGAGTIPGIDAVEAL
ncbi:MULTISPECIES: DUF58 domain-containing protein [Methanoculleus]|uniref:DUF58 domain-containing protein n=2 Tax=Methanoculleus TaxID=45989 RepID=A3CY75_METMJ|nr:MULTISPECIES: DUF58 domain-containing protein [Methanoculleus]ABN58325.1 protein of unknown function DUF58 [Methanoculleus marisnigri JR1]MCC7554564.1 DUF58 domain-containing protein [Methanoculleus marisnigri]UYU17325.1 DUF58 domain-containing protein [Methanoculleus submarinus]